jgi:hypothetical protein
LVATGHGTNFEVDAWQVGRIRCDCISVRGKSRACQGSVVSEDEAVAPETEE